MVWLKDSPPRCRAPRPVTPLNYAKSHPPESSGVLVPFTLSQAIANDCERLRTASGFRVGATLRNPAVRRVNPSAAGGIYLLSCLLEDRTGTFPGCRSNAAPRLRKPALPPDRCSQCP